MKIETVKSQAFRTAIIDAFESDTDDWKDMQDVASKWAKEVCKETIEALIRAKKYISNDVLTFSVSVAFDNEIQDQEVGV